MLAAACSISGSSCRCCRRPSTRSCPGRRAWNPAPCSGGRCGRPARRPRAGRRSTPPDLDVDQAAVGRRQDARTGRREQPAGLRTAGRRRGDVHGVPVDDVAFHDVGALDSIADVVATCTGLNALGVSEVSAGPIALGSGRAHTAHGELIPVPAVLHLVRGVARSPGDAGGPLRAGWGSTPPSARQASSSPRSTSAASSAGGSTCCSPNRRCRAATRRCGGGRAPPRQSPVPHRHRAIRRRTAPDGRPTGPGRRSSRSRPSAGLSSAPKPSRSGASPAAHGDAGRCGAVREPSRIDITEVPTPL